MGIWNRQRSVRMEFLPMVRPSALAFRRWSGKLALDYGGQFPRSFAAGRALDGKFAKGARQADWIGQGN